MRSPALAIAALTCAAAFAPSAQGQGALDRRVSVHVRDVALRDALDRVAAAGAFKLSYSSDNLPLDRRVTVWRDTSQVRDILGELLRPFAVTAVSLPDDQVVLSPKTVDQRDTVSSSVAVLDRVVVTGSVVGASERPLPVALDVVRGRDIERGGRSNLSNVFDGSVPGVWMWEQAPTTMLARYASIRGASSFGVSYPKVYVDGIEVANPLLMTQLTPERVERIEVIRGPQGAALYGSDAISGVVNIISRQDAGSVDGSHMLLRSQGGYASGYGASATAVQQHTLSAQLGSSVRSASGSVGVATSGAYIPEAYSREFRASGSARVVGTMSTLTASAHYFGKNAGVPLSPLLAGVRSPSDSNAQRLRMYTLGSTITVSPSDAWTYAITGGVDGYALGNVSSESGPIASGTDLSLRDASGSAMRATMRASAVAHAGSPETLGATFTFAGEHSTLRDRSLQETPWADRNKGPGPGPGPVLDTLRYITDWSSNMGFTSQVDLALRNTAYLTAGVRQERVGQQLGISQSRSLPMLGGALVRDFGGMTAKLRVAYGKGIRAVNSSQRVHAAEGTHWLASPFLAPEEQSGIEGGVDLLIGSRFGVHLTRFDQLAFNLIQTVMLADSSRSGSGSRPVYWQQLQNVGRISNAGWEAQGTASFGAVSLAGALTTVDSRVKGLDGRYTGDMRPGDRMLGVPARTLTGTASWSRRGMQMSATIARASNWINYDRLAIAKCVIADSLCADAAKFDQGPTLRKYWSHYDGNTRLRAETSFDLRRSMMLTLSGENLLNYQRGEPDSLTIVPGRTLTLGIRARF